MKKLEVFNPHGFGVEYRPNKSKKTITLIERTQEPDPEFEKYREKYLEMLKANEEKRNRKHIDMENLLGG